jgi:peptidoglycan-associated lipoprotein
MLAVSLVLAFGVGCAKKTVQAPETVVIPEQAPPPPPETPRAMPVDDSREREEAAARERQRQFDLAMQSVKDMIHFDFDRSEIKPEFKPMLQAKAEILQRFPNVTITIEGHCDERGTSAYNMGLGQRRASAAREFLTILGVSPERMKIVSFGKEQPLDPRHNEEAWSKNRRDEFKPMY